MVSRKATYLLWGHVADGAQHESGVGLRLRLRRHVARAGRGRVGLRELGETEVEDFDALVGGDEDVLRLQVAMDDALVMRGGKPAGELHRVREGLADEKPRACRVRSRPLVAGRKPVAQRLALEQLRDDVRRAVVLADVVDIQNVRMVQRGRRARLLLEAGQTPAVPGERGRQHFDGHIAAQAGIADTVDFAHPARPEQSEHFVHADAIACGEGHL